MSANQHATSGLQQDAMLWKPKTIDAKTNIFTGTLTSILSTRVYAILMYFMRNALDIKVDTVRTIVEIVTIKQGLKGILSKKRHKVIRPVRV